MFVVLVDFEIQQDYALDFLAAVKQQAQDSLKNEGGCLRFDVAVDNGSNTSFVLYEIYSDAGAFDHHLQTSHFKSFDHRTKAMVLEKRVRTLTLQESGTP